MQHNFFFAISVLFCSKWGLLNVQTWVIIFGNWSFIKTCVDHLQNTVKKGRASVQGGQFLGGEILLKWCFARTFFAKGEKEASGASHGSVLRPDVDHQGGVRAVLRNSVNKVCPQKFSSWGGLCKFSHHSYPPTIAIHLFLSWPNWPNLT